MIMVIVNVMVLLIVIYIDYKDYSDDRHDYIDIGINYYDDKENNEKKQ